MHRRALPRNRTPRGQSEIRRYGKKFRQNLAGSKQLGLVVLCLASVVGFNLVFAIRNSGLLWLIPVSLPSTALLGGGLYLFPNFLWRLRVRVEVAVGRIQAAFLLFFLFFLTVVILYFLLLVLPMGYLLKTFADGPLVLDYRRWSLDLAAVQSLVLWVWAVSRRV